MSWRRGSKCDVEIDDNEIEILERYEAEVDRGLMHSTIWHGRMAQLAALRDQRDRDAVADREPGQ